MSPDSKLCTESCQSNNYCWRSCLAQTQNQKKAPFVALSEGLEKGVAPATEKLAKSEFIERFVDLWIVGLIDLVDGEGHRSWPKRSFLLSWFALARCRYKASGLSFVYLNTSPDEIPSFVESWYEIFRIWNFMMA